MHTKLPKELKGPFVVGRYDKHQARMFLKRPSGEWQLVNDVYPALFIPNLQCDRFPFDAFPEVFLDTYDEGRYTRATMRPHTNRAKVDEILHLCKEERVYPREADVNAMRRWFSDTGSNVANETKALFFDLETKPEIPGFDDDAKKEHRIISISAMDQNGFKWFGVNHTNDLEGEAFLIIEFLQEVAIDYDTLLAWNGNDYDFYVLRWRCRELKIEVNWNQWNLLDYMLTVKKCLMSISDPTFKRSFALDNIGQNVLGIQKLHVNCPMGQLDRLIDNDRIEELRAYNERDVEIMIKLEENREFLALHSAVCSICRMFPGPASLYPNALADGLMLRLAIEQNRHFKSRYKDQEDEEENKYEGAYVMDAELGFHSQVQVIDFSSLYPSIMISWNMSPETKLWPNTRDNYLGTYARATATGIEFRTDREGMLPMALRQLLQQRKVYSQKQKEAEVGSIKWKRFGHESTALKVVANSMYGLLGSRFSRYYDRDIAQSVTLTGQLLIKESINYCEHKGFRVIAGDTDSCFVCASEEDTKEIVRGINDDLIPQLLEESGCETNTIKMDSDKGYRHLLIQAKKKYAGKLSTHKGRPAPDDMKPEVKGLEFQRSDQIRYAQKMQMHFLEFLLDPDATPNAIEAELHKWANEFMQGNIVRRDIEITQSVSKHPSKYTNQTPAVRVATDMINAGKEFYVGMKVPYIVVQSQRSTKKGGKTDLKVVRAIHADDYNGNFDRSFYWIKKVLPPVERLIRVRFPNARLDELESLVRDPSQFRFDFQMNDEKESKVIVKKPKKTKPNIKMPKPKKKASKIKVIRKYLKVEEKHEVSTIKGISKLVKSSEAGNINIYLLISLNDEKEVVVIPTSHMVTNDCIQKIKETFPWVEIRSKSI
jgi:DNA polymerase elongation subunit (family B)